MSPNACAAAALLSHGVEKGKQIVHHFRHLPGMIAAGQQGDVEILLHAQLGKDLPPLGDITNAERRRQLAVGLVIFGITQPIIKTKNS